MKALRKINSEYRITENPYFNITGGTADKKNPQTIYFTFGSYISPQNDGDYRSFISQAEREIKNCVKEVLLKGNSCYLEHIIIMEIADEWISVGKSSYIDFQIYFKPLRHLIDKNNNDFRLISNQIYDEYMIKILDKIHSLLAKEGFEFSKRKIKLKPIYQNQKAR